MRPILLGNGIWDMYLDRPTYRLLCANQMSANRASVNCRSKPDPGVEEKPVQFSLQQVLRVLIFILFGVDNDYPGIALGIQ